MDRPNTKPGVLGGSLSWAEGTKHVWLVPDTLSDLCCCKVSFVLSGTVLQRARQYSRSMTPSTLGWNARVAGVVKGRVLVDPSINMAVGKPPNSIRDKTDENGGLVIALFSWPERDVEWCWMIPDVSQIWNLICDTALVGFPWQGDTLIFDEGIGWCFHFNQFIS